MSALVVLSEIEKPEPYETVICCYDNEQAVASFEAKKFLVIDLQ